MKEYCCEIKEFCDKDPEICPIAKENKQIEELKGALQKVADAFDVVYGEMFRFVKSLVEFSINLRNRRPCHLAEYHPKARVRKKNMARIKRYIKRMDKEKRNDR